MNTVPLAYYNDMGPRYWDWRFWLRGTPLMSVQADINQRGSEGMGISNLPQGRLRPEDYRPPSRGVKAVVSCTSKKKRRAQSEQQSDLLMVGGVNEVSNGWPPRICSLEPYQITNA